MRHVPAGVYIPRQRGSLRVVHLDHTVSPGGAELALVRTVRARTDWRPSVLVPRGRRAELGVFEPIADRIVHVGPDQRPGASRDGRYVAQALNLLRLLGAAAGVRRSAQFKAADVVHANTSRAAVYGAIACAGTDKPLVVHLRDIVGPESLGRLGMRLFVAAGLRRADAIVANSHATLESARPYVRPTIPAVVIPSAAGLPPRPRAAPPAPEVRADIERIGMVARIDGWKGQEVLLRAFAAEFAGTEVRLSFAGGAPFGNDDLVDALAKLAAELGVAAQVEFRGHVRDVARFVRAQDICVQASTRVEPLGQNVLQYLAAGRPTVAVNAGGPAEWIQHGVNGLLYEMGDVRALGAALRLLAADQALRARLAAGAVRTPGLLSDVEVARRMSALFHAVTRHRQEGRPAREVRNANGRVPVPRT